MARRGSWPPNKVVSPSIQHALLLVTGITHVGEFSLDAASQDGVCCSQAPHTQAGSPLQCAFPRWKGCAHQGWGASELLFHLSHFRPGPSGLPLRRACLSPAERV